MPDVSSCDFRSSGEHDAGYLRIAHVYRLPIDLALSCKNGSGLGSRPVKIKDASLQVLDHQFVKGEFKRPSAPTFRQERQPESGLKQRNTGDPDGLGGLAIQPLDNRRIWRLAH